MCCFGSRFRHRAELTSTDGPIRLLVGVEPVGRSAVFSGPWEQTSRRAGGGSPLLRNRPSFGS